MSQSISTIKAEAAKWVEESSEYAGNVCCVDSGGNASDPVVIYGRNGWDSTPFQNAGFTHERLARWLHSQGGCPRYLAEIGAYGGAEVYEVETDEDEDEWDVSHVEDLPDYCYLDQDMVAPGRHMPQISRDDMDYRGECPEDQGQIIVRTWYYHADGPVLYRLDRSDGEEHWYQYEWSEDEDARLEPWNGDVSAAEGKGVEVKVVD